MIQLKVDGEVFDCEPGVKPSDLYEKFGVKEEEALAAKMNGKTIDLYIPLQESGDFSYVQVGSQEGLEIMRHSMAHLMAQAILRIYKNVEFAIGPVIENGFYYDFDLEHTFTPEDFDKIEAEMQRIIKENIPIRRFECSKEKSREILEKQRARFKQELLEEIDEKETFSFYEQGDFTDWCRGPHVDRTGKLKEFKLLNVAGAYWRGDEKRNMLQRVYATGFFEKTSLEEYLFQREEAKKRDHRKLGKDLDFFSFHEEGPGFPFWHPNGTVLYKEVRRYVDEILIDHDYQEIMTPMILNETLWHQSGHWDHYRDNMYFVDIDEQNFAVKPMNCPGCCLIYKNTPRSFRDLPAKYAEWGQVHRHEKRGVLSGLQRVRCFTQDDAHVFCLMEQMEEQLIDMMNMIDTIYRKFGFDYKTELSTRPKNSIGSDEVWEASEKSLENALIKKGAEYKINPGDGAFYGPKIDFHIKDCLGRSWQCGTIQVDMSMPERFDLSYAGQDNQKHRPIMIHRALLGSLERFVSIMIEHFGGAFPTWLAPEQIRVLPISSKKHLDYASEVTKKLKKAGFRVSLNSRGQKLGYEIREGEVKKIPYLLIVGNREKENGEVSVRSYHKGDLKSMPIDHFIETVSQEISERKMECPFVKKEEVKKEEAAS